MNFDAHGATDNRNRAIGVVTVVLLHVLLVWGLMNGLARKAVELLPSPIETKIIEDVRPPPETAPPPIPEFDPPPLPSIPAPEIVIEQPPPPVTPALTQVAPTPRPPPPPPPPRAAPTAPVRVAPKVDLKGSPLACRDPEYPSASERLGETGLSAISLLISDTGKVLQTRLDASSGYRRLDEAAIRAFSRCKFIVGTVDGKPEASWFSIKYKWQIRD
ncbi:MAG: tonB family C-terminal domain protein [Panacagrimonas sp.]|jgi:protein TonB|nr:tonB family C-terminal domain protein [Panacagrimonas sp.]